MSYEIKLEFFEGPLDLLIHLLRENEVDIYDIPIALITEQYLDYIEAIQSLNLAVAGEFLVMAATLTHLKSQMLLPRPELADDDDEGGVDPRLELVERLLEYQRYKEASLELREREIDRLNSFARTSLAEPPSANGEEGPLTDVSLFDLMEALKAVLERFPEESFHEVTVETITVTDRINWLMGRLSATSPCVFQELFGDASNRMEIIITFQALLEVVRLRLVRLVQMRRFGPIHLYRAAQDDVRNDANNDPKNAWEDVPSNGSSASESHH